MSQPSVLIVEDEYLVATDLEAALEERGYSCAGIAPDLETALTLATAKPDVALVDIHLRDGQSGLLIAEHLSQDYGVAVVFVTANPRMALDAGPPGVIGVLNKPCPDDVVADVVAYALHLKGGAPPVSPPIGLTLIQDSA